MANMAWISIFNDNGKSTFLRKGEVGDWKNYLTAEQSAQLDAIFEERLQGTGIQFADSHADLITGIDYTHTKSYFYSNCLSFAALHEICYFMA